MSTGLYGQIAIVTGAGRGFGRAIALRLASEGAKVVAVARSGQQVEETATQIRLAGGSALGLSGDMTLGADVSRVVEETHRVFGDATLLVNNAGTPGPFGPLWEIDPEAWWASQALHLKAPVLLLRAALPAMVARRAGRVIIVSAIAARRVAPYLSAYCVGKLGQTRLVEELAAETKELGVSAFAIDPGFVFTGIAAETMNSPDAQRWLPGMVGRLQQKQADPDASADLQRCAQRCVDLASGRYDALSGKYLELGDDLEAMLQ